MTQIARNILALLVTCHFFGAPGSAAGTDRAETDSFRSKLVSDLKWSEQLVSRVKISAVIRSFVLPKTVVRATDETAEQFVQRCISAEPEASDFRVPIEIERDFGTEALHCKLGEVGIESPKYHEFLSNGGFVTNLIGSSGNQVQATIGGTIPELFRDFHGVMRPDARILRPIHDQRLSAVIEGTGSGVQQEFSDTKGLGAFSVGPTDESSPSRHRRSVRFRSMMKTHGGHNVSWHRVYLEELEGVLIVTRVDDLGLPELGAADPTTVLLLEDYQRVGPTYLPKRLRFFRPAPDGVVGAIVDLTEISVNSDVLIPQEIKIPAGTIVMDSLLRRRYVVGVDRRLPSYLGMRGLIVINLVGVVLVVVLIAILRIRKKRASARG